MLIMVQMIVAQCHFQDQGCGSVKKCKATNIYFHVLLSREVVGNKKVNLRKYSMNSVGGLFKDKDTLVRVDF